MVLTCNAYSAHKEAIVPLEAPSPCESEGDADGIMNAVISAFSGTAVAKDAAPACLAGASCCRRTPAAHRAPELCGHVRGHPHTYMHMHAGPEALMQEHSSIHVP